MEQGKVMCRLRAHGSPMEAQRHTYPLSSRLPMTFWRGWTKHIEPQGTGLSHEHVAFLKSDVKVYTAAFLMKLLR